MREADIDKDLTLFSQKQMTEALRKGRSKGRSGWHDERCSNDRLISMALEHIERGPSQYVDAAVLLMMCAYRKSKNIGA